MRRPAKPATTGERWRDWLVDRLARGLIGALGWLPYERRVPVAGWVFSRAVAPLAGWRRRIRANLALVCPDLPEAEVRRLCRVVPDNIGRVLVELFSPEEFAVRVVTRMTVTGPGLAALEEAKAAGRPALLVSGHFGNFNAARLGLAAQGYPVGALYRPMGNPYFDEYYVRAMLAVSEPLFSRSKRGMAEMLRFLRKGGMVAILIDQSISSGVDLTFFGRRARTAISAAELALRYDALMVPGYATRRANGIDFDLVVEAPIPHGDPVAMTQALNDSLEAAVRRNMDQWFWIHRRWK